MCSTCVMCALPSLWLTQADFAASLTTSQGFELQEVLESELLEVRLSKTLELLKKEKELSVLQQEINKDVRTARRVLLILLTLMFRAV